MSQKTVYLSREKMKALEEELGQLKTVARKEVAARLEYAKSLGDLSENAEYHSAREEQGEIEDRIYEIENIFKNAEEVKSHLSSSVEVGTTVIIKKEGSRHEETYQVVGSEEANMRENKISCESPLGDALMGTKAGDKVKVVTPRGEIGYTIVKIK